MKEPGEAKPPLRVMFLTPYFRPYLGGIERAIEQLAFQLLESGEVAEVGVLTTKYSFPREAQPQWADRETTPEGIAIYRLKGFPKWSIPLYSVPLVWFSPRQINRYLNEFDPDVVHFVGDGWFWGHIWSWFWYRRRARFVFTPSFHFLPWTRWWLRPFNILVCNVMDRVVCLTGSEANQVRRTYLAPKSRQEVIGWGAAPPVVSEQDSRGSGETGDPLTILCVGRLGWHKGQEWLVGVYNQAQAGMQRATRLVCVGRDEDAEESLRRQIAELGLEDRVSLVGEVTDQELTEWYARSDVFTLFSPLRGLRAGFLRSHGLRSSGADPRRGSQRRAVNPRRGGHAQIRPGSGSRRTGPAGQRRNLPPGNGPRGPGLRPVRVHVGSSCREVFKGLPGGGVTPRVCQFAKPPTSTND